MIRTQAVAELNTLTAFPGLILRRDRGIWGAPLIWGLPVLSGLPSYFYAALARDGASATWRAW
jgi:hypothetical protein